MESTKGKTANVFGYTGLTGSKLAHHLLSDLRYSKVRIFVRRPISLNHPSAEIIVNDLSDIRQLSEVITGDEVYCCLGTTSKKAGSKEAFERVDLALPLEIGTIAKENRVDKFLVISSLGANAKSGNFYLKTKGKMEEGLKTLGFRQLSIFRPSLLLGKRSEKRPAEQIGKFLFSALSFLFIGPLKKYKGVHADTVARAMIRVANNVPSNIIYESDKIRELGSKTD